MRGSCASCLRPTAVLIALSALAGAFRPLEVHASNVRPLNPREIADLAGQVLVGHVAEVRSYWTGTPRRIESEVRFEGVEYLKGRLATSSAEFRLVVPGGTVGGMQMRIADAPEFVVGQKWVLFLLPSYKTFPVVGLNQGAFRITADAAGIERVYQAGGRPVFGISADALAAGPGSEASANRSRMIQSDRVQIQDRPDDTPAPGPAIRLDEFCSQLMPILQASRDHGLTRPAGARQPPSYTPASLRAANAAPRSPRETRRQPVGGAPAREALRRPTGDGREIAPRAAP